MSAKIKRLREIQNELEIAPKEKKSKLYMEASRLFKAVGQKQKSLHCKKLALANDFKISDLPIDILISISSYLDAVGRLRLSQCSKTLKLKLSSHEFWKEFDLGVLIQQMNNKEFANVWSATKGKSKAVKMEKPKLLTDQFVKEIKNCLPTQLQCLSIIGSKLTSKSLLTFISKPSLRVCLKTINLSACNNLDDKAIVRILEYIDNLTTLDISGCTSLTDNAFSITKKDSIKLENLNVRNTRLTNQMIYNLVKIANESIKWLDISQLNPRFTFAILQTIAKFKNLEYIGLQGIDGLVNPTLFNETMTLLSRGCSKLQSVVWGNCPRFNDQTLETIALNCPNIHTLDLRTSAHIDGSSFGILASLQQLADLNFRSCPRIISQNFNAMVEERVNSLISINIGANEWVNDYTLEILARCPKLKHIYLAECSKITSRGIRYFLNKPGEKIEQLDISMNNKIPGDFIRELSNLLGSNVVLYSTRK